MLPDDMFTKIYIPTAAHSRIVQLPIDFTILDMLGLLTSSKCITQPFSASKAVRNTSLQRHSSSSMSDPSIANLLPRASSRHSNGHQPSPRA